eukprot:scaffold12886_cov107-Isochrysis_galbana.AAC.3
MGGKALAKFEEADDAALARFAPGWESGTAFFGRAGSSFSDALRGAPAPRSAASRPTSASFDITLANGTALARFASPSALPRACRFDTDDAALGTAAEPD